ncbi:MAG: ArsO family NAD(P)H-dependent flavin-containing monooxygenase [Marinoscillum sp.]
MKKIHDVIIIGGGQSGLAVAYYLRRKGIDYLILDAEEGPGGSWRHYWESLRLFSPAQWSSLPGKLMQGGISHYPSKNDVINYLETYERHYKINIERPVLVEKVYYENKVYRIVTNKGEFRSWSIVSATGTFRNAEIFPEVEHQDIFEGEVLHSSSYVEPTPFIGKRVAIIGEGNSGAQILAELSQHSDTFWITKDEPDYLPDHVDGKYLFDAASQLYEAKRKGKSFIPPSLGHIVMVPSVKDARARGVLKHLPAMKGFTKTGIKLIDGSEYDVDIVIFCTGFSASIDYLKELPLAFRHHKVDTRGTKSRELPGLWMVGYGSWTGFASATLIGVGRSAKATSNEIAEFLS